VLVGAFAPMKLTAAPKRTGRGTSLAARRLNPYISTSNRFAKEKSKGKKARARS
jgi:hypothetical protein